MKKVFSLALILTLSLAFANSYQLEKLSRLDLNPVEAINSSGQVVYAGVGGMLNIYNIYQRDFPQLMNTIEGHSSRIRALIVDGNRLYSLWATEGLEIYDITDPYAPHLLGKFTGDSEHEFAKFTSMDLDGNTMYISGEKFVASVNVYDAENPIIAGYVELNGTPLKIDYYNNKLFAAAGKLGLGAFFTPDPQHFYLYGSQKGVYTAVKAYRDIILYGRLDEPKRDEKNIFGPNLFSFPFESPRVVRVRDDVVFAGGMANFATYRLLKNRKDPVMLWNLSDLPTVDCVLKDDNIYLANTYEGLSVFDISNVEHPLEIGSFSTSDVPQRGCALGDKFYVAAGLSGIVLIDVNSPENPVVEKKFGNEYLHTTWDVKSHNGEIYALGARKDSDANVFIEKFDVDGQWLAEYPIAKIDKLDPIGEIVFGEKYCTVSLGSEGIYILNSTDFSKLYNIKDGSIQFCDIAISQDLLYASDYRGGYQIWKLGDGAPQFVGSVQTSQEGGNGIALVGKYLLAADGPNGLAVINVGNPKEPVLENSYTTVWGTDLAIDGDFAYLSDGQGAMKVFDISHLPDVELVDEIPNSGYWTHIYADNGSIYGIDALAGVYVYRLSSLNTYTRKTPNLPVENKIIDAYPNPFNSSTAITFSVAEKSRLDFSIYDVTGKQVVTLINDVVPAGKYTLHWNSDDSPSGTYFAVLKTPTSNSEQRLILVK
ncbi:T9SS type A sorting domain-containing protein [bacterium]|nr:T9SS type A sorting domain-containing protein [bacterium]